MPKWPTWLVLSLLPILAVTLGPSDPSPVGPHIWQRVCVACGIGSTADAILNTLLFIPMGWVLGRARGIRHAFAWGGLLSVVLELAQLFLVGRFTSALDIVSNTLGAGLGGWFGARRRLPAGLTATVSVVALFAPALLLAPGPPEGVYYGQWTAIFGNMVPYQGRVLEAEVGGVPVPSWKTPYTDRIREGLRTGAPVRLQVEAGPAPPGPAPVFSVFDDRQREVFMLGASGSDVFVRLRRTGTALGYRTPTWWWRKALEGVAPGDSIRIAYGFGARAPCLTIQGRTRCLTATSSDGSWSLLAPGGQEGPLYLAGGLMWAMVLGAPVGLLRIPRRRRALLALGVAGGVMGVSWALPYWVAPWMAIPAFLLGTGLTMEAERWVNRTWAR